MCETERQAEMGLIEFLKFTEQDDCDKYNMLQQSACEIRSLEKENQQIKDKLKGVQEERDYLFNKQSIENKYLAQENQLLEKRIKKVLDFIDSKVISNGEVIDQLRKIEVKELIEILNGKSDE